MHNVVLTAAGLVIGVCFGLFGAGGSAFATPTLALLGIHGVLAVASPLPAVVPSAVAGCIRHLRAGRVDRRLAALAIGAGLPGVVLGAAGSSVIGGPALLVLSGVLLLLVGARLLRRDSVGHAARAAARRRRTPLVLGAAFGVGVLSGLLANGGGFLLVPLFVLVLGLGTVEAAGTSTLVVAALAVPALVTHAILGHVDWGVTVWFGAGMIPGTLLGASLASHVPGRRARHTFGVVLVTFATVFLVLQLL